MRHKPIKLFLPEDLATHVENVDGRKIPAMIFAALRAQWLPLLEPGVTVRDVEMVPAGMSNEEILRNQFPT